MDPNATWEMYRSSRGRERQEYRGYLLSWLRMGGFEPDWTPAEKKRFLKKTRTRGSR
ncbi:MAG: hypothetical protein ACYDH4_11360 [Candidatus Cryosericum sp.]